MAAEVQAAPTAPAGTSFFSRVRPFTGVIALVVLCAVFGAREPAFFSSDNFLNILSVVSVVGILAVGQAFPLIGGGFDLSQGAIAGFTGAVVASLMSRYGFPIPVAVAGGLALGALLGCINGVLVAWVGINPFVATLGTQTAFTGLTLVYTNNQPQALGAQAATFRLINYGMIGPFKTASVLFLALIVLLAFVLKMLAYGQHLYTLGGNEEATRLAGIDTVRLKISTYVASGTLAALASLVMIARAGQASPSEGRGTELESLASCIIGGIALGGGVGGAWNVLLGAITLGVITNGLQMLGKHGVSPYLQPVIRGVIILLAVAVDARARSRR